MWPRKYGWLNFAILECSLNVWIVNKIVFAAPELCESALPNPKFLLHCRKWRNINLSWRKFQTSISSTLRKFFLVKTYKRDQWNLPNILAYISGIFDGFFKAGLVPLRNWDLSFWTPVNFEVEYFINEETEGALTDTVTYFSDQHLTWLSQLKPNAKLG